MTFTRLAVPFALLTGCMVYQGSGIPAEEIRHPGDFDAVANAVDVDVAVRVGDVESTEVILECDDNLLQYIETDVRNGELRIRTPSGVSIEPRTTCTADVTTPRLTGLTVTGSGDTWAEGDLTGFSDAINTGLGRLEASGIDSSSLSIESTGSGGVLVEGIADRVDITVTGSGDVSGRDLLAERADITTTGSGNVELTVTGSVDVTITGSGDVELWGGADASVRTTGSGDVIQH